MPLICEKIPEDREIEYLIRLLDSEPYKGTNVAILVPYSIRDRIKHNGIYQMDNNGNYIFNEQHKSAFCAFSSRYSRVSLSLPLPTTLTTKL